jgi:hypothetical protein
MSDIVTIPQGCPASAHNCRRRTRWNGSPHARVRGTRRPRGSSLSPLRLSRSGALLPQQGRAALRAHHVLHLPLSVSTQPRAYSSSLAAPEAMLGAGERPRTR